MFSSFPFCKKNQGRQERPLAVTLYQSYFYYFSDFSPFFPTSCQHFRSTEQRKSPSHALSQVPPLSDIIPLLAISFLMCILNPVTSQFTKLQCLSKVFKRTLLSKVQSVTLHLLIFSNFFSSFQTTLPEPKFALISKHPVSFHVLWAFAHFCPICMFLPHLPDTCPYFTDQRNAFSAFKNSVQRTFPMKALATFSSQSLSPQNLFISQLQITCTIIPSTLLLLLLLLLDTYYVPGISPYGRISKHFSNEPDCK